MDFNSIYSQHTVMIGKKVLIIDDEADLGFLMTEFFRKKGCKIFVASTLTSGLKILQTEEADLVFMDNNLPDGLGWNQAAFISSHYPKTQLILISATEFIGHTLPAYRILYKPILKVELHRIFD